MSQERTEFERVFSDHRDRVVALAYALCGDPDVARDAAAEAFARTYEQWRQGRVERLEGYLRRAVVNEVNSHFRGLGRLRRWERRREGDARGAVSGADRVDNLDRVRRLLRELPSRQRTAVVLRYWGDLSDAEVAEAMGCPLGTAKSLLTRGLTRLQEADALSAEGKGERP